MAIYFAWLRNNTDIRDDEPLKIEANSLDEAHKIAYRHLDNRFTIKAVYSRKEFKKVEPWWHAMLWGSEAVKR